MKIRGPDVRAGTVRSAHRHESVRTGSNDAGNVRSANAPIINLTVETTQMTCRLHLFAAVLVLIVNLVGCKTAPTSESSRESLITSANQALVEMSNADPTLDPFLKNSYGYAVFPSVGSGGLVVGGGWGRAVVFEQGVQIGFADMTKANIGLTAGGQRFRQLIVFQDKPSLDRFTSNQLTLDANLTAVALTTGAATTTNYRNGVAIFVQPIGGLMVSANVGGQQFRFQPNS